MFGRYNQTTRDRVGVNVINFLVHHLIGIDLLRMNTFLPDLVLLVPLMCRAEIGELVDQPVTLFQLNLRQQRMRGEALEMAQGRRQIRRGEDGVKVVFHDDPGVDLELPVFAAVEERVDEDVAAGRRGEDREPLDNCGGDEVGGVGLVEAVARSHEGRERYEAVRAWD